MLIFGIDHKVKQGCNVKFSKNSFSEWRLYMLTMFKQTTYYLANICILTNLKKFTESKPNHGFS